MTLSRFRVDDFSVSPGMRLRSLPDGTYELLLNHPVGCGVMKGRALSSYAFAATVDFACQSCPSMHPANAKGAQWFTEGTWFSINLCLEGRCEVDIPGRGFAVVAAGDLCVSYSREIPTEYRYPLGCYRGIEVFVNTSIEYEPAFSLIASHTCTLEDMARSAGFAAVIAEDTDLMGYMKRLGDALVPYDAPRANYELLGLLLSLQRRDLSQAKPHVILTRTQMDIARAVHDKVEQDLACSYDARELGAFYGVSAATLNGYFSRVYGQTIAAYVRKRRMEEAAELLDNGCSVAAAALRVGYANPSKFAAVFKRAFGVSPRDWKKRSVSGEQKGQLH